MFARARMCVCVEKNTVPRQCTYQIVFVGDVSVYVWKSARYSTRGLRSALGLHGVEGSSLYSGHVCI